MAAKLRDRFEDILAKKEEACMKHLDIKEDKKVERFKHLWRRQTRSSRSKRGRP